MRIVKEGDRIAQLVLERVSVDFLILDVYECLLADEKLLMGCCWPDLHAGGRCRGRAGGERSGCWGFREYGLEYRIW